MSKTSNIELSGVARVQLPADPGMVAQVLEMYTYKLRNGGEFANYHYKNKVAHLPPRVDKLQRVAKLLGATIDDQRTDGAPLSAPFERVDGFELRDYQLYPCRKLYAHIKNHQSGTLSAGCGTGKTVVMTFVAGYLQKKTLVLLDQSNLVGNWADAYRFIWGRKLQNITSKTKVFGDCCVATFQLLNRNPELLERMRNEFGLLLVDEAHTVKADTFRDVILQLNAKYRVGCSATFFGKNLPQEVLDDLVAPVCVTMVDDKAMTAEVHMVPTQTPFCSEDPNEFGNVTLSNLAADDQRNQFIFKILQDLANQGRRIIAIVIKKAQADLLHLMLDAVGVPSAVYTGTTSKRTDDRLKEAFNAGRLQVVLTCKKMDKGTDLASADALVNTKPNNNLTATQQQSGRIVRQWEGKPTPLVIDLVDDGQLAGRFAHNRSRWYKKLGYSVTNNSTIFSS